jgi:hypothetical protein
MGYTICYHVIQSSRLHLDSMPRSAIRAVTPRTIAHMSASRSCPTARQRANHRLGNPNILNIIQTPQIANHPKSHTYKRLGGIPVETANVRTPLVAQALLPALFCPELFPRAQTKSTTTESTRKIQTRAALLASRRSEYTGQLWTNANSITESRRHNCARALGTSCTGAGSTWSLRHERTGA